MRRLGRVLLYLGIVGVVLVLSKVHAAWIADPPYDYTGTFRFGWSIVYMGLLAVTAYGVGLPEVPRTPRSALVSSVGAAVAAAVAISVVQLLTGDALLPRFVVFGSAVVLVPWYVTCSAIAVGGTAPAHRDRVLVVSDHVSLSGLRAELAASAERPASITSVLPIAEAGGAGFGDAGDDHHESGAHGLLERARRDRASVVVLDREAQASDVVVGQVAQLHEHGMRVRTLSLFYEEWLGKLPLSELERTALMFDIGEVHRARFGRVKRLLDVVLAAAGVLVLVPVIVVVVVGNLAGNRGPLFYRQLRIGRSGAAFQILKFRTMVPAAPGHTVNEWTSEDDPRITRFGRILRLTHLDELPQVVNILRGDLSVVGPRPEQPHYVAELSAKLPFYDLRHLVRPGLTGWAQVKYGYAGDERDALEKLQYDFYYLRHQGLSLDARIVGRTIRSVLGREGR
ncbi:MAG: sugar transferase [Acidimicrobiales bacterium]|jgi:lipopolysaccharide/colanic/teichoic acid biosynthesis glycosyltransferase|nr:sugar transferase [Acidimicrobiales bacterium]